MSLSDPFDSHRSFIESVTRSGRLTDSFTEHRPMMDSLLTDTASLTRPTGLEVAQASIPDALRQEPTISQQIDEQMAAYRVPEEAYASDLALKEVRAVHDSIDGIHTKPLSEYEALTRALENQTVSDLEIPRIPDMVASVQFDGWRDSVQQSFDLLRDFAPMRELLGERHHEVTSLQDQLNLFSEQSSVLRETLEPWRAAFEGAKAATLFDALPGKNDWIRSALQGGMPEPTRRLVDSVRRISNDEELRERVAKEVARVLKEEPRIEGGDLVVGERRIPLEEVVLHLRSAEHPEPNPRKEELDKSFRIALDLILLAVGLAFFEGDVIETISTVINAAKLLQDWKGGKGTTISRFSRVRLFVPKARSITCRFANADYEGIESERVRFVTSEARAEAGWIECTIFLADTTLCAQVREEELDLVTGWEDHELDRA